MAIFPHGVRCTVSDDGAVWMHLDVRIPPNLLKKSQVLMDAVTPEDDHSVARDFTLAAPSEWLQAWSLCCCSEEQRLSCAGTRDLVNCLMVCSFLYVASFTTLYASKLTCASTCASTVRTATRELHSTRQWNSMDSFVSHLRLLAR
jgi:hypothetical protein